MNVPFTYFALEGAAAMMTLESVTEFGLFVAREFLPEGLCSEAVEHMRSARRKAGTILVDGRNIVDLSARRTHNTFTPMSIQRPVAERIRAVMPDLARHFGATVTGLTELQFLCYEQGDFFMFHRDRDDRRKIDPEHVRARQISVVIFLNDPGDLPTTEHYGGGELQFFVPDLRPGSANTKFSLRPPAGTLVAFDPQVLHQVRPVTHGRRYTVVAWCV